MNPEVNEVPVAEQVESEGLALESEYAVAPDGTIAPKEDIAGNPEMP